MSRHPVHNQQGMVTAEAAVASLIVAAFVLVVVWVISLVMLLTQCQDTAAEIARQEARGDRSAVTRAMADRPGSATVRVSRDGRLVRVRVDLAARPWASWLPSVPLSASAVVMTER